VVLVLSGGLAAAAAALAWRGSALAPRASRAAEPLLPHVLAALRRRTTWLGLLFAATAGAGFEVVGVFAGPFLETRGHDSAAIGLFLGVPAVGAMVIGALGGGHLADRFGIRRTVFVAGLALGAAVLVLAALTRGGAGRVELLGTLTVIYLGIGVFTAASYALFMSLTDPALGATQFSAYMGATNLCESWSARAGGTLAARAGFASAFAWLAAIALAALALLPLLRPHPRTSRPAESNGARDPLQWPP
jgi:predicted MFS family arabinose efflux permease